MTKFLRLKFTGSILITPDYPDDLEPIDGTLYAVMPGARRRRPGPFSRDRQIDAQFAFVTFDYAQLVVTPQDEHARNADYVYPDVTAPTIGACFLERESMRVITPSDGDGVISFVKGDVAGRFPTVDSRETKWIARWKDFGMANPDRPPKIRREALQDRGDYVRVEIPGGELSAGFAAEPIALIDFDFGPKELPLPYAQEIVVTRAYPDSTQFVQIECTSFPGELPDDTLLTFRWGGRPTIDLLFGNGPFASFQSVLTTPISGHDHEGDYDFDFAVLYDSVIAEPDDHGRLPLPRIRSLEILKVPCVSTTIAPDSPPRATVTRPAASVAGAPISAAPPSASETPAEIRREWRPRTSPSQRRERSEHD